MHLDHRSDRPVPPDHDPWPDGSRPRPRPGAGDPAPEYDYFARPAGPVRSAPPPRPASPVRYTPSLRPPAPVRPAEPSKPGPDGPGPEDKEEPPDAWSVGVLPDWTDGFPSVGFRSGGRQPEDARSGRPGAEGRDTGSRSRPDGPRRGGPQGGSRSGAAGRRGPVRRSIVLGAACVFALALAGVGVKWYQRNTASTGNVSAASLGGASQLTKPTTARMPAGQAAKSASTSTLAVPAGWKLTFDPSFSGSSLDTSTWATCYDFASDPSVGCTDNPTIENEWYVPSQVSESDGTLDLTATRETTEGTSSSGAPETYGCRSGMVTSKPGFNFMYGLISITAKLPYGPGLWPALWLAATNDDWPPELDIMEHWYSEQDYKAYDHTVGSSYVGGPVPTPVNLSAGFNTFSLLWTPSRVTWYLNGEQEFTTTDHVPQQDMYFIANVADRNPSDGTTSLVSGSCNGTMEIQSVKVWQP